MANEIPVVEGVRLVHVENHDVEMVFVNVAIESGSSLDPAGKEGLANLTASMLLRGTGNRTYQQIMDEVNDLGANLDTAGRRDFIGVTGDFMPRYADRYAAILADVLGNPVFDEKEFERERALALDDLRNVRNDDADLARHFFPKFLYGGHPLSRPTGGYISTVGSIEASDCRDFYKAHVKRGAVVVALAGAIDEEEAKAFVKKIAAGIPKGAYERKAMPQPPRMDGIKVLVVDKPGRTQAQVIMGRPSISWDDPDLFPILVGNTAFGGTFTSRLMREIREKRGWSYGASSGITAGREFGTLAIRFFPANKDTAPAIGLTLELLADLVKDGLKDEETAYARNHITKQFPFRLETARKRAAEKMADVLYDRPADYISKYIDNVNAQDTRAVNAALAKWFDPKGLAIVVVGTAKDLVDELKKVPGVKSVEVHPYDVDKLQ